MFLRRLQPSVRSSSPQAHAPRALGSGLGVARAHGCSTALPSAPRTFAPRGRTSPALVRTLRPHLRARTSGRTLRPHPPHRTSIRQRRCDGGPIPRPQVLSRHALRLAQCRGRAHAASTDRNSSRASITRSARPLRMISSACAGDVISPTDADRMPTSRRTRSANGTWYPDPIGMRAPATLPPELQSMRSAPSCRSTARQARPYPRSSSRPPSSPWMTIARPAGRSPARRSGRRGPRSNQPDPILERAAVRVGSRIRQRRVEAVRQIRRGRRALDPLRSRRPSHVSRRRRTPAAPWRSRRDPAPLAHASPARTAPALGATGSQPPFASVTSPSGSHGRRRLAFRPACAS